MNPTPKVSIVIPVYNGSDYLSEAIDSALAQTYPEIEVIVVNDGSSDGGATERVALAYGDRIRYFVKENGGVASALNRAIAEMRGEYFSWLSHDDLYHPDKVRLQMEALQGQGARTILYSDAATFTDDPDVVRDVRLPELAPRQFRYFLTMDSSLHGCTLLIPKAAFEECGLFDERLRTTQDYDMWFRLAARYGFVHIPRVLVKARNHAAQGSIRMRATAVAECNALLSGFISRLSAAEVALASGRSAGRAYATIADRCYKRGFSIAARNAIRAAANAARQDGFAALAGSAFAILGAVAAGESLNGLRRIRDSLAR